jgi:hypothetical protein
MGAANALVHWVCDSHPVPEVRQHTFRRQDMLPTPPGDVQPNPPDSEANIQHLFDLRTLPIDDLALSLGDELFARGELHEVDLAIAYQIAAILRRWRDANPHWRLPELAAQLADVAQGRRHLPITAPADLGYEPSSRPHHPDDAAQRQRA